MDSQEEIIEHSYMGERIEFVEANAQQQASVIEYYHYMQWKGSGYLQEHVHPHHDEYFEVIKGTAHYSIRGKEYKAQQGTIICIPKGKRHINPYNAQFTELVIKKRDAADLKSDRFYRQLYRINGQKKAGGLSWTERFRLASSTNGSTFFTHVPCLLQKTMLWISLNIFRKKR
jgi:mannose-6-phosphate isomerase-like protein (cupin superfamily)